MAMTKTLDHQPLGQRLLGKGLIQPGQLDRALDEQRRGGHLKLLGEVLVELRQCSEAQIAAALAESYGLPFAEINPRLADPKVLHLLPRAFVEEHSVLPLFLVEGVLTVAVPEPADVFLIDEVRRLSGKPVQLVVCTARDVAETLKRYRPDRAAYDDLDDAFDVGGAVARAAESADQDGAFVIGATASASLVDDPASGGDAAAAKLVDYAIYHAARDGASEVHLEPSDAGWRVRYRIDGRLVEKLRPPVHLHAAVVARLKAMAGLDPAPRLPQEGTVRVTRNRGRSVELPLSTMPGPRGEKLVLRLPADADRAGPPNLEKLGFAYDTLKQWRKVLAHPGGLVLVTGPAGSGKRTTLHASLDERADDDLNVCVLDDRPACPIAGANHFTADERAGLGYPAALRALLRQGPDLLMVGDLPDPDTAALAAGAALHGQLVLAAVTLHNGDAAGAITRLLSLGVEPYTLGTALVGVLSQRLVRKLCPSCKEPYAPTGGERRQVERYVGPLDLLHRPKGCPRCKDLGYAGRVGVYELLVPDESLAERIAQGVPPAELREAARQAGWKPLRADGMEKVKAGITSLSELCRVCP